MKRFYFNIFTLMALLMSCLQLSGQAIVINAPKPVHNPNLSGESSWDAVCAGNGGFNEYFVEITWAGTANANNSFILELSDETGDFATPVTLNTITDKNTEQSFLASFSIPETTRGSGYKLRVRSTDPAKNGTASTAFEMYYMDVTKNLNISELGDGVPPGGLCSANSITLRVDNIDSPESYQYIWFRSGTQIPGEFGHTLEVTQSGMYNTYIDYGTECTGSGNTDSNIVDVTIGASGTGIAINAPSKTALCSTDTETLTTSVTDPSWSYQWYKDNVKIPGATGSTYTVDASNTGFEGDYAIEISGYNLCTEKSTEVSFTNADAFTVTRDNPENMVVLPSQTQTLSVSTTANAPTYKWFRNAVEISGETNSTLDITQNGNYYAEITQTGGTCAITSKNSEITTVVTPASFDIVVNYMGSYTDCVSTDIVIEVTSITAIADNGSTTDVTADLIDTFTYQWKKDGAIVTGQNGKSISIASNAENGNYSLDATLEGYNETSNTLGVQLLTNQTVSINSTSTVYCDAGETVTLSASIDLSAESYEWQLDGTSINSTDTELNLSSTGTYQLVLDKDGCELVSNEVTISSLDSNLITLEPSGNIVIPEGTSKMVTARGGTAYRWLNASNTEMSTSDSVTFTQPGTYTLIANIDNCEIVRQVEVSILDTFKVPNVITVNGDGINDHWVIPNSYSDKVDVNVIIYNEKGEEIVNEFNYKNNWPLTSTAFTKQNMVFYYKIMNANEVLKQGTITVIR